MVLIEIVNAAQRPVYKSFLRFEDIGSVNLDCDAEIVQLQMKGGCTSVPQVLNQEEQAQYC